MSNSISQIKRALNDPACEGVRINVTKGRTIFAWYGSDGGDDEYLVIDDFPIFEGEVESFAVSHNIFDPLDVGDLVSTKDGLGTIQKVADCYKPYLVNLDGVKKAYFRHDIVLLEKGA